MAEAEHKGSEKRARSAAAEAYCTALRAGAAKIAQTIDSKQGKQKEHTQDHSGGYSAYNKFI